MRVWSTVINLSLTNIIFIFCFQDIHLNYHPHQELKEEVDLTLALLKKLEKPDPPRLEVKGAQEILVEWNAPDLREGLEASYRLFTGKS